MPVGNYLKDVKNALNKDFALAALVALAQTPELARRPLTLWKVATGGVHTRYAYQMDVVLALWNAGITKTTPAATASAAS